MIESFRQLQQDGQNRGKHEEPKEEQKPSGRMNRRPSIATCTTPLGKFEQDIVKVRSVQTSSSGESADDAVKSDDIKYRFCKIQVRPVYNFPKQPEKGLKYYAIELDEVRTPAAAAVPSSDYVQTTIPTSLPSLAPTTMAQYYVNHNDYQHKQETGRGVVYLPMPSGCMTSPPLAAG